VATAVIVLLLVLAALWLADADAERMRAAAKPIGPGWDPDAGIAEEARAGFLGLLGALVGAPYVAVALLFDVLALRRLGRAALAPSGVVDVGLGDEIVERPRAADYRSDASPDVALRGSVEWGRTLMKRAIVVQAVVLLFAAVGLLMFGFVSLAAALA
jgi:hypothetical protein